MYLTLLTQHHILNSYKYMCAHCDGNVVFTTIWFDFYLSSRRNLVKCPSIDRQLECDETMAASVFPPRCFELHELLSRELEWTNYHCFTCSAVVRWLICGIILTEWIGIKGVCIKNDRSRYTKEKWVICAKFLAVKKVLLKILRNNF